MVNIFKLRPAVDTDVFRPGISTPEDKIRSSGRDSALITLARAVYEIESATSPFANLVKRLEVTPPGQPLRIITPKASSPRMPNSITRAKATRGSSRTWAIAPARRARGWRAASLKSLGNSVMPRENIMNARLRDRAMAIIDRSLKAKRQQKAPACAGAF
jgi:hypothetical protein